MFRKLQVSIVALAISAVAFSPAALYATFPVFTGGDPSCIPAPGDYDGDGDLDFAQLCGAAWHFYNPDGSYIKGIFVGVTGGKPVPADYNGDGKTDVVLFNGGAWHFYDYSTGAYLAASSVFVGGNGLPVPMDYDGDGTADFTQYANGAWHFYNDNGSYNRGLWLGNTPGNVPVPFNRDIDRAEEVVLFNNGVYHFFDFDTLTYQGGVALGTFSQPVPAPIDLDGDGILELGVFTAGTWHFYSRTGAYLGGVSTGNATDKPISRRLLP
ncbi:MAG: VCBS repeat-containing protein [Acidobacteriota bacterium]